MSDTLLFFVPVDAQYDFNDVADELSSTYCTITHWNIHSQDESGWWYAVNINWDNSPNNTINRFQSSLFMAYAYIYVGHKVNQTKTVFHDVNIFCPRIYDYANLYKQHTELLEVHGEATSELNRVKEINEELDRDNVALKTKMEEIKKHDKKICKKYDSKCEKYKSLKRNGKFLEEEIERLTGRNAELSDRYPQHC